MVLASGCRSSRNLVLAEQEATIDSLRAVVYALHTERDSLRSALEQVRARIDTVTILVKETQYPPDSLFQKQADSLRHQYVMQFMRGQEQTGRLRGQTLDVIYFESGSTRPTASSLERLNRVAAQLRRLPAGARILLEGHTDGVPFVSSNPQNNRVLSAERAEVVRKYLVERSGISPDRFETAGFGADMPLFPNEDAVTRRANRRVRIAVLGP